jgi:AcrR family transcriptional regulator
MPKETFFNLPEEKRALICRAAVDEFAAHPFEQASINRIVARSGIAKGSFYQYFEDKSDLFLYLLQRIADEKLKFLSPVLRNPEQLDLFTLLRELSRSGIEFAMARPKYAQISTNLLAAKGTPIYKQFSERTAPSGAEFFEALLKNAVAKDEVRADIDIAMLAHVITSMYTAVTERHLERVSPDYCEKMMETIDRFLDVLKHGIVAKSVLERSDPP